MKSSDCKSITDLTHKWAQSSPKRTAVVFQKNRISYEVLDIQSTQVAYYLIDSGLEPGQRVGVYLDKSELAVIFALGILKAGGTLVFLNIRYPSRLLEFIINDAQCKFIISASQYFENITQLQRPVIDTRELINTANRDIVGAKKSLPFIDNNAISNIVYTSGTTGQPKGVMVSHGNLMAMCEAWRCDYRLASDFNHLQMATLAFDVFMGDLIRALCTGGKLILCPEEITTDPYALYGLMKEEQVNCAEFVPTVLRSLISYLRTSNQHLQFMKLLMCGSDTWTIEEYKNIQSLCSQTTRVINSYGLTECTVDSTFFEADATLLSELGLSDFEIVPLGKPFVNTQLYIMNENLKEVEDNEEGIIFIGGSSVAQGYWNRPVLTNERFIVHNGHRLYNTGDKARRLPDGNIIYLGRGDKQLKIDGHRIEASAIEAILNEYPKVNNALVLTREARNSRFILQAYIVSKISVSFEELVSFLKTRLPFYSIPKEYFSIDHIPVTYNGKVRRDGCDLSNAKPILPQPVPPHNEIESGLLLIMEDILQVNVASVDLSFFEMGGNSLLAKQFQGRVEKEIGIKIDVKAVFQHPTISQLSKYVLSLKNIISQEKLPIYKKNVVIIGGGAVGVSALAQLVHLCIQEKRRNICIYIIEKSSTVGAGLPYSTPLKSHVLNLPANVMSPLPEQKELFVNWLKSYPQKWQHLYPDVDPAQTQFPPRALYGLFLCDYAYQLKEKAQSCGIDVEFITGVEAIDMDSFGGNRDAIQLSNDKVLISCHTILAIGHMESDNFLEFKQIPGFIHSPWPMEEKYREFENEDLVVIIGTRLTAIDEVLALHELGYRGKIILVSRSGMLPKVLGDVKPYTRTVLTVEKINALTLNGLRPLTLAKLMGLFLQELQLAQGASCDIELLKRRQDPEKWFRSELASIKQGDRPWQNLLFSLYPIVPHIWHALCSEAKTEFLIKINSTFMSYLAAFPAQSAEKILYLLRLGQLEVLGGFNEIHCDKKTGVFTVVTEQREIATRVVINATGAGYNVSHQPSRLLRNLIKKGELTPSSWGGVEVTFDSLQAINRSGQVSQRLYVVGEATIGTFRATTDLGQASLQVQRVIVSILKSLSLGYTPSFYSAASDQSHNNLQFQLPSAKL